MTRTAMYLWAEAHPQKAQEILRPADGIAALPTMTATQAGMGAWLTELREQATIARRCGQAAEEWLWAAEAGEAECQSRTTQGPRRPAEFLAENTKKCLKKLPNLGEALDRFEKLFAQINSS